eukprot:CAMPEP_0181209932 /NCGR_PEP_ID=MMETSP1096-20121128/22952_1 /TAXON_ID=156174 ORGANISM="Chrysochromulina ericina, Strain CCMP281" /NCGR_SAMPLE_ID=MMETSP1096 /ASSEMBLY_ACC=CAM_ASM_000453 /LENGTH=168 /DNA_ID=CAMNT_0023301171 /DNA_START=413 /DNA_END=916 /DNA_ORIENTATION=+
MVKPVEDAAVRAVDGQKSAAHEAELVGGQMRHVDVSVLEPRVEDQPHVSHHERGAVEGEHCEASGLARPRAEGGHDRSRVSSTLPYVAIIRPQALAERGKRPEMVGGAVLGTASRSDEEVCWPAYHEVGEQPDHPVDPPPESTALRQLEFAPRVLEDAIAPHDDRDVR